jgi:radical SAM superfamily enzyme YgiQ (UPF0313 family)
MRALLIYPEYPETFWNFKHALRFIAKRAPYPPLGLLTIAALFPADWELRLVDMNVTRLREEDLRWAELVCLSAMSIQADSVRAVMARCQAAGVPIVAGGPLFTSTPDDFAEVDYLVLNEAEVTLPRFLADFQRGQARHCYTDGELADLNTTPIPRWDLIRNRHYAAMNIQLSRGCPYDCEFCNITSLFGRVPRLKDTALVLAELDALYQTGWRGPVFFVDDNFIGNKRRVKEEILPAIIDWAARHRHPFLFNSQVSLNLADDPELLALMARAGFITVFIGIESPNDDSLTECNKIPNAGRDLLAGIKTIQRAGLQVQGGFIVGFDSDPVSIFDRVSSFIQESGIATAMVGLLNAPRGTRLYQRLEAEGRLLGGFTGDNTDCTLNFTPAMNLDTLLQGYQRIIESIYAPHNYYARVQQFLRDFRPAGPRLPGVTLTGLLAGLKCAWVLGLREPGRRQYWQLVFWSLTHHPRLLPLAIELAVYGFHFRKCFERHWAKG